MSFDWRNQPVLRKVAFIAATVAPLLAITGTIVLPIQNVLTERDADIARNAQMLTRLMAIAAYKPPSLPDLAGQVMDEYFQGPGQGVATANLQARLKMLSETSGARLRSVQGLPPESQENLSYIGARLEIFGSIQAVQRAISAIEEARPYFFVTATILKRATQSAMPGNAAAEPVIDAQLDVFAAFRQDASP